MLQSEPPLAQDRDAGDGGHSVFGAVVDNAQELEVVPGKAHRTNFDSANAAKLAAMVSCG